MSTDDAAWENIQLREALQAMGDVYVEGLRNQLKISDDWVYRSGYIHKNWYKALVNHISENNIIFVSGHVRENNIMRFSIFISPEGMEKLKTWVLEKEAS